MSTAVDHGAGPAAGPARALVVDDEPMNRLMLEALLEHEGYEVAMAGDGVEAVTAFGRVQPEIVFMDLIMPVMDGLEATRRIKSLAGERFVPVIFLTALPDEQALAQCVAAGGDDFLSKPYDHGILRAKIQAMQRIRDLYEKLHAQREQLRLLQAQRQRDDELAQVVFGRVLSGNSAVPPVVRSRLRPAAVFSGDLMLMAARPDGGLHVLLGDFTGHGLGAALGALPVAELFRALTARGVAVAALLAQLNERLRTLLPRDMFLSACLLHLDRGLGAVEVWNGGMPDALVIGADGRVRGRLASRHLPLGIVEVIAAELRLERVPVRPGDRVLLCSDGVIEARNPLGEEFGEQRLVAAIEQGPGDGPFAQVLDALDGFCAAAPQEDDASLVEIPCVPEVLPRSGQPGATGAWHSGWQWRLELTAQSLRRVDPVPLAMNQLFELAALRQHDSVLYTILTELYANALNHGVLQLDSAIKSSGDGFERYYRLREERLAGLERGSVRIEIEPLAREHGGRLRIVVEDSGRGFDSAPFLAAPAEAGLCGRGITLVRSLCESLRYERGGSRVEAIYAWDL